MQGGDNSQPGFDKLNRCLIRVRQISRAEADNPAGVIKRAAQRECDKPNEDLIKSDNSPIMTMLLRASDECDNTVLIITTS